jgi:hypothetical protein
LTRSRNQNSAAYSYQQAGNCSANIGELADRKGKLDAEKARGKGSHRLFSARDAVLLSAAAQVTAIGTPFAVTKFVAEMIVAEIVSSIGGCQLYIPCLELVVFRRAKACPE